MELPGRRKKGRPQRRLVDVGMEDMQRVDATEEGEREADDPLW